MPSPKQNRSLAIKLWHGLLGFFSGMIAGPYVGYKRLNNHYRYLSFLGHQNAWARLLYIPAACLSLPFLFIYPLYAMFRGSYLGFVSAIYKINDMIAQLGIPTSSHFTHTDYDVQEGCDYLAERFDGVEDDSPTKVVALLYSSVPDLQTLAEGYCKQRIFRTQDSYHFYDACSFYMKGCWDNIHEDEFNAYLLESYSIQRNPERLQHLRTYGITLQNLYNLFKRIDRHRGAGMFAMIADTLVIQGGEMEPSEALIVKSCLKTYLDRARCELISLPKTDIFRMSSGKFIINKDVDYVISYMFTGFAPYPAYGADTTVGQALHELYTNHLDLFPEIELLSMCMVLLIKNYLNFLSKDILLNQYASGFIENMLSTIVSCFQNDRITFEEDETMHRLIDRVNKKQEDGVLPNSSLVMEAREERIHRAGSWITEGCNIPRALGVLIAEYQGVFFRPEHKEDSIQEMSVLNP